MSDKPIALLLGASNPRLSERVGASFELLHAPDKDALDSVLEKAPAIQAIAVLTHWPVTASLYDILPDLKVIANFGVGYDTIDAVEAAKRGILVTHTPDVLNDEVTDTVLMLWLALSRQLLPSERWARSGAWADQGAFRLTHSIRNRTVGIVGLGRIGLAIAKMAEGYGSRVLYHGRSEKNVPYTYFGDLIEMAKESDLLIVVTPGGDETRQLVNRHVIDALGRNGLLINVARGSVVDETALTEALVSGRLGGAGLDVFEDEPRIPDALKSLDNVVLLPHVGSGTIETRQAMSDLVCDNLLYWQAHGKVLTPVPECLALNT